MTQPNAMADVGSSQVNRRRFLGGAMALAGGIGLGAPLLAGCGGSSAGTGDAAAKTIGISLNGLVEYTRYVAQGVAKAFEGGNYNFKVVQANFDVQTELRNIEGLVSQAIDGLVVLPNTVDAVLTPLKDAKSAGVKIGLALWAEPGPLDQYVVGVASVDSIAGGKLMGEWLKAKAKPGKVIVVQGVLGQGFSEQLDQGLDEALTGSGFEVVVREQGFFDRNKAIEVVERGLQAHPDVTAIVTYAATMSDGVASFLKQNNIQNVTHVGDDCDTELQTWLGTPYLSASRYYSAAETGFVAGQAVRAVLEGKEPTFENKCFQAMMSKENMVDVLKTHPMSYPDLNSKLGGL